MHHLLLCGLLVSASIPIVFRGRSASQCAIQHGVPEVVLTVDALGVDLQEHFDAMAGPLRYLSGGCTGVETQGDARVAQVVRSLGELGGNLRRCEGQRTGLFGTCPLP
jgi:hypothetical protein